MLVCTVGVSGDGGVVKQLYIVYTPYIITPNECCGPIEPLQQYKLMQVTAAREFTEIGILQSKTIVGLFGIISHTL